MPNNSNLLAAMEAMIAQVSLNAISMPTGDQRRGGQRPRAARRIVSNSGNRNYLLVAGTNPIEQRVHEEGLHTMYLRPDIGNHTYVLHWVNETKQLLTDNGLTHLLNSNYFFNNECGVYVLPDSQVVVHSGIDGRMCEYHTRTTIIYHLIGYLALNRLIPTMALIDPRSDNNKRNPEDNYEF